MWCSVLLIVGCTLSFEPLPTSDRQTVASKYHSSSLWGADISLFWHLLVSLWNLELWQLPFELFHCCGFSTDNANANELRLWVEPCKNWMTKFIHVNLQNPVGQRANGDTGRVRRSREDQVFVSKNWCCTSSWLKPEAAQTQTHV